MDMYDILSKLRIVENDIVEQCNMTAEGENCPVHGIEECGSMTMEEALDNPKASGIHDFLLGKGMNHKGVKDGQYSHYVGGEVSASELNKELKTAGYTSGRLWGKRVMGNAEDEKTYSYVKTDSPYVESSVSIVVNAKGKVRKVDYQLRRALDEAESDNVVHKISHKTDKDREFVITKRNTKGMKGSQDPYNMHEINKKTDEKKDYGSHPSLEGAKKFATNRGFTESIDSDKQDKGDNSMSKKNLDETSVNISLDGEDADHFLSRLMQLSGQASDDAVVTHVNQPVSIDVPAMSDAVSNTSIDLPVMNIDDNHYMCNDCGEELTSCSCDSSDECVYCGQSGDNCTCDSSDCGCGGACGCDDTVSDELTTSYQGVLDSAMKEGDYGHETPPSTGEEVDQKSYIYNPEVDYQRIVRSLGDNSIARTTHQVEETVNLFNKLQNDYQKFIAESEFKNDDGIESPLTATDREEFDMDPFSGTEPKTDGSMSPMSTVKRQDVMR